MNTGQRAPRDAGALRAGALRLLLVVIVSLLPAAAPHLTGAHAAADSQIRYPISDVKIGIWAEGVPTADVDNLRYNEIDDPAPSHDGDATYVVASHIKSYRAGVAAPAVPPDASKITVSIIWTVRLEVADSFHVVWTNFGVNGIYYFGPRHNPGTAYTTYTDTWTTDPSTGLPWSPASVATVNGLGFDFNVESPVRVTQAYIRVDYESGPVAALDVEKHVWDGTAWADADTAPGPNLAAGTNPQFRFVVANTGTVDLSNVDLTDNVYGAISLNGTLAAGTAAEYFLTGTWSAGQHTNTATATGDYEGNTITGTDDANYFGAVPAPAIDVEKYVWRAGLWADADTGGPIVLAGTDPLFKFVVTNSGNTTLEAISLSDSPPIATFYAEPELATGCAIPGSLAPQQAFTCYGSLPWAQGRQTDVATARGTYAGNTYTDSDVANYLGGAPAVDVEKYVWDGAGWVDADVAPGPSLAAGVDPQFRFVVANTGNLPLSNVAVTDNVLGSVSSGGTLAVRGSAEYLVTGTWEAGQHANTATATATYGGIVYTDSDDAHYYGAAPAPALALDKTASPAAYGSVGDVIAYNYRLTNSGDFPLDSPFTVGDDKVSVACPDTPGGLAPGDSIDCTAGYVIALSDLEAGSVTNTAQAKAYYGGAPLASNQDVETVRANESQLGTATSTCASVRDRLLAGSTLEQTQILYTGADSILYISGVTNYWTRLDSLSGSVFHLAVRQSATSDYGFARYLGVRQLPADNVVLYDANCRLVTGTVSDIQGGTVDDATFSFTFTAARVLSGGPYVLQVRYDHALLRNQPVGATYPASGQVLAHYDFATLLDGTVVARDSSGSYAGGYGGVDLKRR